MPFRPNSAPLATALFIIMLVVRSTTGMAMVDGLPENALRTFQLSDTLHIDLTPLASRQKRYLRSSPDVTTTSTGEVRRLAPIAPELRRISAEQEFFSVRLRKSLSTTTSKIMARIRVQWWLWFNKPKTPAQAFKSLRLDKGEVNPFENPKFPAWKFFVEKMTAKDEKVTQRMFDGMVDALGDESKLVWILLRSRNLLKFGDTVKSLRDYQIGRWIARDSTPGAVYDILRLNEVRYLKDIPTLPGFTMWAEFNTRKDSVHGAVKFLNQRKIFEADL